MLASELPIQTRHIAQDIIQTLRNIPANHLYVGFSGGADSTLLLTLCCQAKGAENITALHVNHQLSPQAEHWQQHAEQLCRHLGVQFQASKVAVESTGKGLEAAARQQRYHCFSQWLPSGGVLLLGHHADDQVETFFLRLFRGAGKHGLQGMPSKTQRDHYLIERPLIGLERQQIITLAEQLELRWIDDESNLDEHFDRNFLRQSVLPLIESRWPGYRDKILQTMDYMVEDGSVDKQGEVFDVDQALSHRLSHDQGLKLVQLDDLSPAQLLSLLHRWLLSIDVPVPSTKRLQAIVDHVIHAQVDAQPCVEISGGEIRRHGPALYWLAPLPKVGDAPELVVNQSAYWAGVGRVAVMAVGIDVKTTKLKKNLANLHWRLRAGGEQLRPVGRSKKRDLKRLFQEYRHKPWLRDRTPLLYSGDQLIAVGDLLQSAEFLAAENEPGLIVQWQITD